MKFSMEPIPEQNETLTFEQAMARLEEIVRLLESGELSLDETVRLYEEGQRLRQFCEQKLKAAEKRIKMVTLADDGTIQVNEFEPSL
ncbi:MAG: exodeoxyribonuclease VII small subunit [Armatimonadetes bacterium]|nr:exodeoxyribonuclease VII small subunit [Armatimonadota bacterium]MCX7967294.1 exodeoxyribonuclease VII small subunit [Armatimonadota bacterium]MDW8143310.1 exodeoxyribonuclease VII small subunit [Armatimonadota bacterium]